MAGERNFGRMVSRWTASRAERFKFVAVYLVLPWVVWREMWVRDGSTEEGKTREVPKACSASRTPQA